MSKFVKALDLLLHTASGSGSRGSALWWGLVSRPPQKGARDRPSAIGRSAWRPVPPPPPGAGRKRTVAHHRHRRPRRCRTTATRPDRVQRGRRRSLRRLRPHGRRPRRAAPACAAPAGREPHRGRGGGRPHGEPRGPVEPGGRAVPRPAPRDRGREAPVREHVGVIAISSPGGGDGKTTTAVNLAGALAQAPRRAGAARRGGSAPPVHQLAGSAWAIRTRPASSTRWLRPRAQAGGRRRAAASHLQPERGWWPGKHRTSPYEVAQVAAARGAARRGATATTTS